MSQLTIGSDVFRLITAQQGSQPAVYQLQNETDPVALWRQARILVLTTGARIRVNGSLGIPRLNAETGGIETATVKVELQMPAGWAGTNRDLLTDVTASFASVIKQAAEGLTPNPVDVDPLG